MKFHLLIECDNAAFADDCAGEVARVLRDAAARVADGQADDFEPVRLRDVNGNRVGWGRFED